MNTTKTHIIIAAALFLAVAQGSWATTGEEWNDSVHSFGSWSTELYTATNGAATPDFDSNGPVAYQSEYMQDPDLYETFGYGIFHNTVSVAQEGTTVMPVYVEDLGLNPAVAPGAFSGLLTGISVSEYVLYPQSQSDTLFVQYGRAEGLAEEFVVGPLTPIAALNDFQNGQAVAVYFGSTYNTDAFASVTVDFGAGTWGGIFLGPFDVKASGSLEGQFFYSEAVSGFQSHTTPVSGMVAGSFYGPGAEEIAGVIDITRNGERLNELFDAQKVDINIPAP